MLTVMTVLVFSTVSILKEVCLMLQQVRLDTATDGFFWRDFFQRNKYARDIINLIEWVLNISAILTSLVVLCPDMLTPPTAHVVAAIAVFCAWFNYLLYLQRSVFLLLTEFL
jgi:hypothetical protein